MINAKSVFMFTLVFFPLYAEGFFVTPSHSNVDGSYTVRWDRSYTRYYDCRSSGNVMIVELRRPPWGFRSIDRFPARITRYNWGSRDDWFDRRYDKRYYVGCHIRLAENENATATALRFQKQNDGEIYGYLAYHRVGTGSSVSWTLIESRIQTVTVRIDQLRDELTLAADATDLTPYALGVETATGALKMSIPITVPPGRNGLQPELSISYNSHNLITDEHKNRPRRLLGYGWDLSGISSVTRCTLGRADELIRHSNPFIGIYPRRPAIKYTNEDPLCLDDNLLVLVSGQHMTPGARYRTQIESNRIVEIASYSAGIQFKVMEPSGRTLHYGSTSSSRVHKELRNGSSTPVFQWALAKVLDEFGNSVTYSYIIPKSAIPRCNFYNYSFCYTTDADLRDEERNRNNRLLLSRVRYTSEYDDTVIVDFFYFSTGRYSRKFVNAQLKMVRVAARGWVRKYKWVSDGQSPEQIQQYGFRPRSIQECGYTLSFEEVCRSLITVNWSGAIRLVWPEPLRGPSTIIPLFNISSITDSLGRESHFTYHPTGDGRTPPFHTFTEMPTEISACPASRSSRIRTVIPVVTSVKRNTGTGSGVLNETRYRYHCGKSRSSMGGGYLGYRATRIQDMSSGITTYQAHFRGGPWRMSYTPIEHVYTGLYGQSGVKLIGKEHRRLPHQAIVHENGNETNLTLLAQRTKFVYENGSLLGVQLSSFTNNLQGALVTRSQETTVWGSRVVTPSSSPQYWGDTSTHTIPASAVQRKVVTTRDFLNRTGGTDWKIGFLSREQVDYYNGGATTSDRKRKVSIFTPWQSTMVIASKTMFSGDSNNQLTTSYTYDAEGNRTSTTVSGAYVSEQATRFVPISSGHPQRVVTNAKGHIRTESYFDHRFGIPLTITDANGRYMVQQFDAFGRKILHKNKDRVATSISYESCQQVGCSSVPTLTGTIVPVYRVVETSAITPESRVYYDQLDRPIMSETRAFDGTWAKAITMYDVRGRKARQRNSLGLDTVYTYDNRDRVVRVDYPDGGQQQIQYSLSGGKLKTTTTMRTVRSNGGGTTSRVTWTESDMTGQITKIVEAANTTNQTTTTYQYDALENVSRVVVNGGSDGSSVWTFTYDNAGNRISASGPNIGTIETKYNALGQVRWTRDGAGRESSWTYDELRRQKTHTSPSGTSSWGYDSTGALGLLISKQTNRGFRETYRYNKGRLMRVQTNITQIDGVDDMQFSRSFTYDTHGRISVETAPKGHQFKREYNSYGYFRGFKDSSNAALYTIERADEIGIRRERFGNNVYSDRRYDTKVGRLLSINTKLGSTYLQRLSMGWNSDGTLEYREDTNNNNSRMRDEFTYDNLRRLKSSKTKRSQSVRETQSYTYDRLGNIKSKTSSNSSSTQMTAYQYNGSAVTSVQRNGSRYSLSYNAGGAVSRYSASGSSDKFFEWNARNQPSKIVVGSSLNDSNPDASDLFKYGPDGDRYYRKTVYRDRSNVLRTRHVFYVGNFEYAMYSAGQAVSRSEKVTVGGKVLLFKHIDANNTTTTSRHYLHQDHLGSTHVVTDNSGSAIAKQVFNPFGERRHESLESTISGTQLTVLSDQAHKLPSQGFTGHEMLDGTGFIHMNGRLYDADLGRFLSPDPIIGNVGSSQSWNVYSYVRNNPLSVIDPSGYTEEAIEEIVVTARRQGSRHQFEQAQRWWWSASRWHNLARNTNHTLAYVTMPNSAQINMLPIYLGHTASFVEVSDGDVSETLDNYEIDLASIVRKRIVALAYAHLGSKSYAKAVEKDNFGEGTDKCNLFTNTIVGDAGASVPFFEGGTWAYTANAWANTDKPIDGWRIVKNPMPGDVAAFPRSGRSGHVGIYVADMLGPGVIAANQHDVGWSISHWLNHYFNFPAGASGDTVYRRYVGNDE